MFIRREQECGPFLGFIIREDRDALILVIEAPKTPAKPPTPYSGPTPQQGIPVKSLVGIHSGASVGGALIPTPHRRRGMKYAAPFDLCCHDAVRPAVIDTAECCVSLAHRLRPHRRWHRCSPQPAARTREPPWSARGSAGTDPVVGGFADPLPAPSSTADRQ